MLQVTVILIPENIKAYKCTCWHYWIKLTDIDYINLLRPVIKIIFLHLRLTDKKVKKNLKNPMKKKKNWKTNKSSLQLK